MSVDKKPASPQLDLAQDIQAFKQQLAEVRAALPTLTQNDKQPHIRSQQIAQERSEYTFDYTQVAGIAMLKHLPKQEYPTFQWIKQVGEVILDVIWNQERASLKFKSREWLQFSQRNMHDNIEFVVDQTKQIIHWVAGDLLGNNQSASTPQSVKASNSYQELKILFQGLQPVAQNDLDSLVNIFSQLTSEAVIQTHIQARKLSDYTELFQGIPLPLVANRFQSDQMFGYYRVAGPNSTSIKRAPANWQEKVPLSEAQLHTIKGYDSVSLEQAMNDNRLFLLEYPYLDELAASSFPNGQKYIDKTQGLFYKNDMGHIMPLAIRCAEQAKVFTPNDNYAWEMAKNMLQVADANYHELVAHLGETHLVMEAFVIVSHRQFAQSHPVFKLLAPHFEGTAFINWAAKEFLVAKGNFVDKLLAGTIDSAHKVIAKAVEGFQFNTRMPDHDFQARGVDDANLLYPYRDDALMVWEAINSWVSEYIDVFYSSDVAVQKDAELQAWGQEVVAATGGRIADFGEAVSGSIQSKVYLSRALSMIVFTASAQHAAVNFPQSALMSYLPSMPLASYAPAPTEAEHSREDWLAQFAPIDTASQQLAILHTLGSVQYTTLGQYDHNYFKDDRIAPMVEKFQYQLKAIQQHIAARNAQLVQQGLLPYEYLSPQLIPQSINI